eukprot:1159544-Pelagomonas_calceolata.AAC.3
MELGFTHEGMSAEMDAKGSTLQPRIPGRLYGWMGNGILKQRTILAGVCEVSRRRAWAVLQVNIQCALLCCKHLHHCHACENDNSSFHSPAFFASCHNFSRPCCLRASAEMMTVPFTVTPI